MASADPSRRVEKVVAYPPLISVKTHRASHLAHRASHFPQTGQANAAAARLPLPRLPFSSPRLPFPPNRPGKRRCSATTSPGPRPWCCGSRRCPGRTGPPGPPISAAPDPRSDLRRRGFRYQRRRCSTVSYAYSAANSGGPRNHSSARTRSSGSRDESNSRATAAWSTGTRSCGFARPFDGTRSSRRRAPACAVRTACRSAGTPPPARASAQSSQLSASASARVPGVPAHPAVCKTAVHARAPSPCAANALLDSRPYGV
jgi:hypothetical protein